LRLGVTASKIMKLVAACAAFPAVILVVVLLVRRLFS